MDRLREHDPSGARRVESVLRVAQLGTLRTALLSGSVLGLCVWLDVEKKLFVFGNVAARLGSQQGRQRGSVPANPV